MKGSGEIVLLAEPMEEVEMEAEARKKVKVKVKTRTRGEKSLTWTFVIA